MSLVPGQVRSTRWMTAAVVVAGLLAGLGGCVSTTTTTTSTSGEPHGAAEPPKRTAATEQAEATRRARVRLDLAYAYLGRGQAKDALDEVKQALDAQPDNAEAYGARGLIYANLGDFPKAEESFRRSEQLGPNNGDVMHNYGWFLCQQQRYADAQVQFARAEAEPTYREKARTMVAQGVCQARAGQLPDSERTLSHAYELDPTSPVTAVNLAEVLYKLGEFDRARFYIRRVNAKDELSNAQSLWLAARIERKLGADDQVQDLGAQLHKRFPQAPETLMFEKGRFDE